MPQQKLQLLMLFFELYKLPFHFFMSLIRIFIHVVKKIEHFYDVHVCLLKLEIDMLSCCKGKSSWCCAILAPIKSRYLVIYTRIKSTEFAVYYV